MIIDCNEPTPRAMLLKNVGESTVEIYSHGDFFVMNNIRF